VTRARLPLALVCAVLLMASSVAVLVACGPFLTDLIAVNNREPAFRDAYSRGNLGVVKPRFYPRYLLQAYRVFNGRAPVRGGAFRPAEGRAAAATKSPVEEWDALVQKLQGPQGHEPDFPLRALANYQYFDNCLDDAFATATRTLSARIERYGSSSREVREWLRGQLAVFGNCSGRELVLPDAAPAWADDLLQADRRYQIASAYFYGLQYDEAAWRFHTIAEERNSPWRPYGKYLAARAAIRRVTVPEDGPQHATESYTAAESDLNAVLADSSSRSLQDSARGLIDYVAARTRPADQFLALSRRIADNRAPSDQEIVDYLALGGGLLGWPTAYAVSASVPKERIALDDLSAWVSAMTAGNPTSVEQAIERWRQQRSLHWLVAAMWNVPASHPAATDLLNAASAVGRESPAFATIAVARARLLIHKDRAAARSLLAALPTATGPGVNAEALNLLRAERLMVADTFDEFIANAPRAVVVQPTQAREATPATPASFDEPVFDRDAADILNDHVPLDRLVDAALSERLPRRLRIRVGSVAFARAVVLRREDAALRLAPVLQRLVPHLRADLEQYRMAANQSARHRAGILVLVRAPGMLGFVRTLDNDVTYAVLEPARRFNLSGSNPGGWWCWQEGRPAYPQPYPFPGVSDLRELLYGGAAVPAPLFISADERQRAVAEKEAFRASGDARSFLAREAIAWARATPTDPLAAEALARVVDGWRHACGSEDGSDIVRRAFTVLHRQYPNSEWAKRTRYWYR